MGAVITRNSDSIRCSLNSSFFEELLSSLASGLLLCCALMRFRIFSLIFAGLSDSKNFFGVAFT